MEENLENRQETQPEQAPGTPDYLPRPRWQVWAARVGLVLFLLLLAMYYILLFRGG